MSIRARDVLDLERKLTNVIVGKKSDYDFLQLFDVNQDGVIDSTEWSQAEARIRAQ
ncbi:MAG: hypothetical protein HOH33_07115 [Verrucomicrobia bacterium]|jgi:hypothetical protein|nr:hypothetical protein [Verrucomicrobiota bacterium]